MVTIIIYHFYGSQISKYSICCRIFQNDRHSTWMKWCLFETVVFLPTYSWLVYILLWDEKMCLLSLNNFLPWQKSWKRCKLKPNGAVTIVPKYSVALSVSQWLLSERFLWSKTQPLSREDFPVSPTNLTIFPLHISSF